MSNPPFTLSATPYLSCAHGLLLLALVETFQLTIHSHPSSRGETESFIQPASLAISKSATYFATNYNRPFQALEQDRPEDWIPKEGYFKVDNSKIEELLGVS